MVTFLVAFPGALDIRPGRVPGHRRVGLLRHLCRRQRVTCASMGSSARKSIPDPVTNRLFALSGNQCAFPGCTNAVTDQVAPGEQPVTLAQRAHIVGVGRQGPRSRAAPLSDDIDAVENLLLLCGEHHRIVDNNPRIYSVEVLAKYKADHEAKMAPRNLRPGATAVGRRHSRSVAPAGLRTARHLVEGHVAVPDERGGRRAPAAAEGRPGSPVRAA